MEELLIVRRTRFIGDSSINKSKATIKVTIKQGRFNLSKKATSLMKLENESGLMFGFNYKEKTAYIFKDDEDDAFRVYDDRSSGLRFTSKDLKDHFVKCFQLNDKHLNAYFEIEEMNNSSKFKLNKID